MDCAKKIFDNAGLSNYVQVKVTDLGIAKVKGVRCTDEQVTTIVDRCNQIIAAVQETQ